MSIIDINSVLPTKNPVNPASNFTSVQFGIIQNRHLSIDSGMSADDLLAAFFKCAQPVVDASYKVNVASRSAVFFRQTRV